MQLKNRKFKRWQFAMQLASCGYGLKPPVNRLNTRRNRDRLRAKWWNLANEDMRRHMARFWQNAPPGCPTTELSHARLKLNYECKP